VYRNQSGEYPGGKHVGFEFNNGGHKEATLHLEKDEFITDISGRHGDVIDHLTIKTSRGKEISVGGEGGNPHGNLIQYGKQIVGFGVGTGGHLHNLYVYYLGWVVFIFS